MIQYPVYDKNAKKFIGVLSRDNNINRNAESINIEVLLVQYNLEIMKLYDPPTFPWSFGAAIILLIDLNRHNETEQKIIKDWLEAKTPMQEIGEKHAI